MLTATSVRRKPYKNIYHACNWFFSGLENTILGNPEGGEEYENAKATLANHNGLVAGTLQHDNDRRLQRRKLPLQPGSGKLSKGYPVLLKRMADGPLRSQNQKGQLLS